MVIFSILLSLLSIPPYVLLAFCSLSSLSSHPHARATPKPSSSAISPGSTSGPIFIFEGPTWMSDGECVGVCGTGWPAGGCGVLEAGGQRVCVFITIFFFFFFVSHPHYNLFIINKLTVLYHT
jgi:hypothetical protein